MSKLNRLKYETYSKLEYLVNQKDAEAYFRVMSKFPNAVGFDKKSNGYLVINKTHSPSGLESEVGGCVVLKKLGYCVELLNESPSIVSLDVKVNDLIFEMKCFSEGKDLLNGIIKHFKRTYHKSDKLVLHINKKVEFSNIKRAIRIASEKYSTIKTVILIFENKAIELNKNNMKSGKYVI